jgi:hypothetical protein
MELSMTTLRLLAVAILIIAGPAAVWISKSVDIPEALIEVTLLAVGGSVLTASIVGRLTPEIARSWRPELGILLLIGVVGGAVALASQGMPFAAAGTMMAGVGPVIITLRAARLLGSEGKGQT